MSWKDWGEVALAGVAAGWVVYLCTLYRKYG